MCQIVEEAVELYRKEGKPLPPSARYGLAPFQKRGAIVTNELIDRLRQDDAY